MITDGERISRAGGIVEIGPECFALADGSVLSWKGENYVPQKPTLRVRFHNWRIRRFNNKYHEIPCDCRPGCPGVMDDY